LIWITLGVAHYRAGDWKAAVTALQKSLELRKTGDIYNCRAWLFLAMAHWQMGKKEEARRWYQQAVQWMERNQPALEEHRPRAKQLRHFRDEAAELLGIKADPMSNERQKPQGKTPGR
jgi:tetratricopeptide (TPR) repeat protein